MKSFIIGFMDTDPDTGEELPFIKICECTEEWAAKWIFSTLTQDFHEYSDDPNREIILTHENT